MIAPRANDTVRDFALAMGALPDDAGPARQAVLAGQAGDRTRAAELIEEARRIAPHSATTYLAAKAVAEMACEEATERDRRLLVLLVDDARPAVAVRIVREAVYRDYGFGPSQPPALIAPDLTNRWPWPLLDERPACADQD